LTVEKKGKKNVFSGASSEVEGLPDLKVEQAFELTDASASAPPPPARAPQSGSGGGVPQVQRRVDAVDGGQRYQDRNALERRIKGMEAWLAAPKLLQPDIDAEYAAVIDIDLDQLKSPWSPARTIRRCQAAVRSGREDH